VTFDGNALYWIHTASEIRSQIGGLLPATYKKLILPEAERRMTYLDVVFQYESIPGENELRAIDNMREVYGIRSVRFNEKERTVRVEFDASRLKQDAVSKLLRQAGIDVNEPVALA
jgi:hypothetical protein